MFFLAEKKKCVSIVWFVCETDAHPIFIGWSLLKWLLSIISTWNRQKQRHLWHILFHYTPAIRHTFSAFLFYVVEIFYFHIAKNIRHLLGEEFNNDVQQTDASVLIVLWISSLLSGFCTPHTYVNTQCQIECAYSRCTFTRKPNIFCLHISFLFICVCL